MNVAMYINGSRRSRLVCTAMAQSLARERARPQMLYAEAYDGAPRADVAVFYGLAGNLKRVYQDYRRAGKTTVFFDLGYWGRHEGGRYFGYHRVCVNSIHATAQVIDAKHPGDRAAQFGFRFKPFKRAGSHIVLAGQSAKAAWVYDFQPEEWEHKAVEELRKFTDRKIYYYPKLSWGGAKPIPGTEFWNQPVTPLLDDAWAVVTHHSNTGLDALMHGVPVFSDEGIASTLGVRHALRMIEEPRYPDPDQVRQLVHNATYWQWAMKEMETGKVWDHIRREGLL
jgi:hypothetical protein